MMCKKMRRPEYLFSPIKIGGMELKNRLVMAPLCTNNALEDGSIQQSQIDYYMERAKGGVGMIIVEITNVIGTRKMSPKCLGIYSDHHILGLKNLVMHLKSFNVKVVLQVADNLRWENLKPSELTIEEIYKIINKFVNAVVRGRTAGFDAVEFHMCHCYTLSDFLSGACNDRKDEFGKGFDGRMMIVTEIVERSKEKVGKDYPMIGRINGDDFLVGGNTLKDSRMIAKRLEEIGVHAIDVSCGGRFEDVRMKSGESLQDDVCKLSTGYSGSRLTLTQDWPDAANIYLAEGIKDVVRIPVIGGGKITNPQIAEKVLRGNKADMVYLGRPLLRDPYFPVKAKEGRWDEIQECEACNYCVKTWGENKRVECKFSNVWGE